MKPLLVKQQLIWTWMVHIYMPRMIHMGHVHFHFSFTHSSKLVSFSTSKLCAAAILSFFKPLHVRGGQWQNFPFAHEWGGNKARGVNGARSGLSLFFSSLSLLPTCFSSFPHPFLFLYLPTFPFQSLVQFHLLGSFWLIQVWPNMESKHTICFYVSESCR